MDYERPNRTFTPELTLGLLSDREVEHLADALGAGPRDAGLRHTRDFLRSGGHNEDCGILHLDDPRGCCNCPVVFNTVLG